MSIKYTNIFHCKALQNIPKFGFLGWKHTIWQPWRNLLNKERTLLAFTEFQGFLMDYLPHRIAYNEDGSLQTAHTHTYVHRPFLLPQRQQLIF
jgi:hypothetical protein